MINASQIFYTHSPSVPLGTLAVSSYLTENGHTVRLEDRCIKRRSIKGLIDEFRPDAAGISFMSFASIKDGLHVARILKKAGIPVIAGGNCASSIWGELIREDCIDYISVGEGEISFSQCLDIISGIIRPQAVPGIAYMKDGEPVKNDEAEFCSLEKFPEMDWKLINPADYFQHYIECSKMLYVYSGKGCPGKCAFCYNKQYNRCKYRARPVEKVVNEIEYLVNQVGADGIYFSDEIWYPDKRMMHSFCEEVKKRKLKFVWGCQTRVDVFGEEDYKLMYECGCRWIFFGVESGCESVLERMNKGICLEETRNAVSLCKSAGITAIASFVIGYIDETKEEFRQTVEFAKELDANITTMSILIPFPNTDVYTYAVEKGY